MNYKMKLIKNIGFLISMIAFGSCADLEIENPNAPDRDRALSNTADVLSLLKGSTTDLMFEETNLYNVHIDLAADQVTATNNYLSFWAHGDQPRRQLDNSTTYADNAIYTSTWNQCNSTISISNIIISQILNDGVVLFDDSEVDKTTEALAGAYFIRGLAQTTIGMLYDQGYVVDENTDLGSLELQPYNLVLESGLASFDLALEVLEGSNVGWEFYPTAQFDNTTFKQIVNSYAARAMISMPRTKAEAATLDYSKILSYANNGLTTDFMPIGEAGVIYHNAIDWEETIVASGAGYIPTDQKIPHLFDSDDQPADYPTDANTILPPAVSNDARLEAYYTYTSDFGYLNPARRRALFSNYYLDRWPYLGQDFDYSLAPIPYFLKYEIDYIKAECQLMLGSNAQALSLINGSARSEVGGLSSSSNDSKESIEHLLFYEYSIELATTGKGIQLYFMRRHDLLQKGTPLHYPVPAQELELLGLSVYTYGGEANADGVNTADGSGAWNK